MTALYITSLSHRQPHIRTQSQPQFEVESQLYAKKKDSQTIQDLYLRYLIDKEMKFANIDKINTYYQTNVIKQCNQFNHNKYVIQQKHFEYNKLLLEMMNDICQHFIFPKTAITDAYDKEIGDLTYQIKVKEHQCEVYQNMQKKLYLENFMMKKRIETEQKYSSIYNQQHNKYILINHHSKLIMLHQQRTLNESSQYYTKSNDRTLSELNRKGKYLTQLESEVNYSRVNISKYKQTMKTLHNTKIAKMKEKNRRKIVNEFELKNHLIRKREYHKIHTHILSIFKELKVKDLDELIAKFIKLKIELQNIHSLFGYENDSIRFMNNEQTKHEEILSSYRKQIMAKQKNHETERTMMMDSSYNNTAAVLESRLDEKRYAYSELNKSYSKRLFYFQKIFSFIINCNKKINKEIKIRTFTKKRSLINYIVIDREIKISDIDMLLMKHICELFVLFANGFFFLLYRSFNCAISEKFAYSFIEDDVNTTSPLLAMTTASGSATSISTVSNIFSQEHVALYYTLAEKAISNIDTKLKYMKKNEENLYVNMNMNRSINMKKLRQEREIKTERKGITQRELFNSFINHLENKKKANLKTQNETINSFNGRSYIENHPRKIVSIIGKYQNELVSKDKMPLIKSSSNINIDNRANRTTAVSINTQRKNNSPEHTQSTFDWDNSYEESTKNKRKKKGSKQKQSMYSFYKGNEQMSKIYNRLNDLRSLELKYKEKSDIDHDELVNIYNSFKSKVFRKDKRRRLLSQSIPNLKTNRIVQSEETRSFY